MMPVPSHCILDCRLQLCAPTLHSQGPTIRHHRPARRATPFPAELTPTAPPVSESQTLQVLQKLDQAGGVIAPLASLKIQFAPLSIPAITEGGANGHLLPVECVNPEWRLAFRRPGASDGGPLRDATLVLEEDPGFAAPSVFFTVGHCCSNPSFTFFWSRSRARLAGRCKLQSMAPRTFPI